MYKLKLHNNGHPFKNDNLDHLSKGINLVADTFLKSVTPGSIGLGCRLTGCDYTLSNSSNTIDVTAGYITLYNGSEYVIYQVDAHQVTKSNSVASFAWTVVTGYEPAGQQVYADGTPQDVHEITKAVLVGVNLSITPIYVFYNAPYLSDLITGGVWKEMGHAPTNFLTDDEPTVDWALTSANLSCRSVKVNKTRHVQVRLYNSTVTGGSTQALIVKLQESAAYDAIGTAFIFGHTFCICTVNAGSNLLSIQSIDGGALQNISGSLIVVKASITYEVA